MPPRGNMHWVSCVASSYHSSAEALIVELPAHPIVTVASSSPANVATPLTSASVPRSRGAPAAHLLR